MCTFLEYSDQECSAYVFLEVLSLVTPYHSDFHGNQSVTVCNAHVRS